MAAVQKVPSYKYFQQILTIIMQLVYTLCNDQTDSIGIMYYICG